MPSTNETNGNFPPLPLPHFHAASSFFCFCSVKKLRCIGLLAEVTLNFAVFWSSRKLTSLRGAGASALPPLTIFHSLSALQPWPHCTQMGHPLPESRCCCIPAQHRRACFATTFFVAAVNVRRSGGGGGGVATDSRRGRLRIIKINFFSL